MELLIITTFPLPTPLTEVSLSFQGWAVAHEWHKVAKDSFRKNMNTSFHMNKQVLVLNFRGKKQLHLLLFEIYLKTISVCCTCTQKTPSRQSVVKSSFSKEG